MSQNLAHIAEEEGGVSSKQVLYLTKLEKNAFLKRNKVMMKVQY